MNTLTSIFGELTKVTQARIDAAEEAGKSIFQYRDFFQKYFTFGDPTISTDFTAMLGRRGLVVAAPTIELGANEPIVSTRIPEKLTGSTFRHATSSAMDMDTYRKVLEILDSKMIKGEEAKRRLLNIMFGEVQDRVSSVYAKLFLVAVGMLSNEGIFEYTDDNNPEGAIRGKIIQKLETSAKVSKKWTSYQTPNVLEDIVDFVLANKSKKFRKVLLTPERMAYILRSGDIRKAIFDNPKTTQPVSMTQLNSYMQANGWPIFEEVDGEVNVQDVRGTTRTISAFNGKNLVFVGDGKLGVVENAYADEELRPSPGVAYSRDGRVSIAQWGTGRVQGGNTAEFTAAEILAQPVFDNNIGTLKVDYD